MRTPILDSQISRALIQPTPWEVSQWRQAALRDKAEWSKLLDSGRGLLHDDTLRSVDIEIRRDRMQCGPAPCSVGGAPVPTELSRIEYYHATNLFSWMRVDSNIPASANVGSFVDKVYLPANGGLAGNARSIVSSHSLTQATAGNQVALPTNDSNFNNRPTTTWAAAGSYSSTLANTDWIFAGNTSRFWLVHRYTTFSTSQILLETINPAGSDGFFFNIGTSGQQQTAVFRTPTAGVGAFQTSVTTGVARLGRFGIEPLILRNRSTGLTEGTAAITGTLTTTYKTLEFGSRAGGGGFKGQWADMLIAGSTNATNSTLDTLVNRYVLLRYGVSP